MLFLAHLLGRPVCDADGQRVGTIADFCVVTGDLFPRVSGILMTRRGRRAGVLPWELVARIDERGATLAAAEQEPSLRDLAPDEILLRRDILDQQIVDLHGRRVVRVNDLRLARTDGEFRLVGVDVGARALLRRLNLEWLAQALRLRMPSRLISWNYVQPVAGGQAGVRLHVAHDRLRRLPAADLADILGELDPPARALILNALDNQALAEALPELEPGEQVSVLESLPTERAGDLLEILPPDEAADVLGDLPDERAQVLLAEMEPGEAAEVRSLLQYPDTSAGGRMTTEFTAVGEDLTAAQALGVIRRLSPDAEIIYYLYVVDDQGRLAGVLSLRDLIIAQADARIGDIARREVLSVNVDDDQEEVARRMSRYDLLALPVTDAEGRLAGVVTVDDVLHVMADEASEDLSRLSGGERAEITSSAPRLAIGRLPAALLCLAGGFAAAAMVATWDLPRDAQLVGMAFLPLLVILSGQVGTHSSALVVRAISLGEHEPRALWAHLSREGVVAALWGIGGGLVSWALARLWSQSHLGLVMFAAMPVVLVISAVLGTLIPLALWRVGVDPALARRPVITVVATLASLPIYALFAQWAVG